MTPQPSIHLKPKFLNLLILYIFSLDHQPHPYFVPSLPKPLCMAVLLSLLAVVVTAITTNQWVVVRLFLGFATAVESYLIVGCDV